MSLPILARAIFHTLSISLPTVLEALTNRVDQEVCDERLSSWATRLLDDAGIELRVVGLENIDPKISYVVMSNHASLYDIPVLYRALPLRLRMAAKTELFRVPIWGQALAAAGFVRIDRRRGAEARQALLEAGLSMQISGISLWVAPEGTRSPDGQLLPFKTGAFALALAAGLPILPVTLSGTRSVLGKRGWRVARHQELGVLIHPPLVPEDFPAEPRELVARVRARIQNTMPPSISR